MALTKGRVRKRGNVWSYIINIPYDPIKGNYPTIRKSGFATQKEAFAAMSKAIAKIEAGGDNVYAAMTVDDYLIEWINQITNNVSILTVETYRHSQAKKSGHLGSIPLNKLNQVSIERMYKPFKEQGLADSTVHRVLRTALNRAVNRGLLATPQ